MADQTRNDYRKLRLENCELYAGNLLRRCLIYRMRDRSILNGFDTEGRPVLYMRPGRENTSKSPRQIQHLVFHL
jgi:hypothetical protein